MLDSAIRPLIDPPLNFLGKRFVAAGFSANAITLIGFIAGIIGIVLIWIQQFQTAAFFIVINRFLDGIDGAIARQTQLTDFGGFLDITCDFIIYAGIVFAFGITNPHNLWGASFLLFSFIGPITSFLAYAIIAAKREVFTTQRGKKSFYHLGGICEGTETAFALILMCLIPIHFNQICFSFGILCWFTTSGRVYSAWKSFPLEHPSMREIHN